MIFVVFLNITYGYLLFFELKRRRVWDEAWRYQTRQSNFK